MFLLSGFPVLERKDSIIGARLRLYKKRLGAVCKTAPTSMFLNNFFNKHMKILIRKSKVVDLVAVIKYRNKTLRVVWITGLVVLVAIIISGSLRAQTPLEMDEGCTVTLGNQTANVRTDGTFFVRNVAILQVAGAAAPQLFRVRATCLRDGEAITGQSDFFSLTPAQTFFITDVFPMELDPIPSGISVSAPDDFVLLGETVQLGAVATLPDGTTEDVTLRAAGTTYISSNINLLTVDENGLVTGTNNKSVPQSGLITVLNEGNVSTIFITSAGPSNDLDNDGMPNDYEELFGLDPLVNDANGDLDDDGLTNIDEFNLGTIPNNPDTDGDGAIDGRDVNPLIPDKESPTVIITEPADGANFVQGETVIVKVLAEDNDGIDFVDFKLNGIKVFTDTTEPYEYQLLIPDRVLELGLSATAFDFAGLSDSATPVVINVLPRPGDSDGDGISDATEILLGSDPNDASSIPAVIGPAFSQNKLSLFLPRPATESIIGQSFSEEGLSVYLPIGGDQFVTGMSFAQSNFSVFLPGLVDEPISGEAFSQSYFSILRPRLVDAPVSGEAFGMDQFSVILPVEANQPLSGPSFGQTGLSILVEE